MRIIGARENNLRDVTLDIPHGRITVFTGRSGSGKSSLAFGTVAVEARRQMNETYTWFVRNRLPKYQRPKADAIERLTPAVVVDQRPIGGNARSTVGTASGVHSVLRVLFSRVGVPSAGEATAYSFNEPAGMCPECEGIGVVIAPNVDALLDVEKSLNDGALRGPGTARGGVVWQMYAHSGLFDPDLPLRDYPKDQWDLLLYGEERMVKYKGYNMTWRGVVENFVRLHLRREVTEKARAAAAPFITERVCGECGGARLNKAALATRVAGLGIAEMCAMEVGDLIGVLRAVDDPVGVVIAGQAVEALERIAGIGLDYLSLDRATGTLSGGEGQRLKMVRHLGSALTGMTYVFDEPSTGLHPRDVHRLNELLVALRDKGNTVLVVEHDRDVIAIADHVVDMGPGAGTAGGRVVFEGTPAGLAGSDTVTGRALSRPPRLKDTVRRPTGWLSTPASALHNLRDVALRVPTGVLTAVTGVAGSGKSSLVTGVFAVAHPEAIVVDQSPIPVSARSTPASFLGALDGIRRLFAREHGVQPGLFSFNSTGACETCGGRGEIYTDLAYMDPVRTPCDMCGGRRFKDKVLAMRVRGRNIADVLDLSAAEAVEFFAGTPMAVPFAALTEAGLPYLALGRTLSTLSGGERQRLKLASRLRDGGLYILDEPTTGLHMADVDALIALLDRMVDAGNTVVVIEHDLDVVARADWVVDLGPGGGRRGGQVVYEGVPGGLKESVTGRCLVEALG